MTEASTIHVIDDSSEVRESLAILLDTAGFSCRAFASALDFLKQAQPSWIGCIVADVRMPAMTGIELMKELRLRQIRLPVIIITGHADVPMAVAALKSGAVDFIEKPFRDELLLASIRSALASQASEKEKLSGFPTSSAAFNIDVLSPREQEVMLLLVAGHPNKVVADRLGISVRTVEVHRAHIMEKTATKNITELVRLVCVPQ